MCNAVGAGAVSDCLRISRTVIQSDKGISGSIKSVDRMIDRIYRIVIAAFPVFRLVINGTSGNLYFTCRKIPLEVRRIVRCIPETEFNIAEKIEFLFLIRIIGQCKKINLTVVMDGNESKKLRIQAVL